MDLRKFEALQKELESLKEQLKQKEYNHETTSLCRDNAIKAIESRDNEIKQLKEALKEFYIRMDTELQREPINRARYMNVLHDIYEDLTLALKTK